MSKENKMDNIISWAKRRGFIFPSSEIYGGLGGVYDFGPYGVALKNNLKRLWWKRFVEDRDDVVGLESAILMNKKVWEASGHKKGFVDWLITCQKCSQRYRWPEDFPQVKMIKKPKTQHETGVTQHTGDIICPKCHSVIDSDPEAHKRHFNLMFKTFVGPAEDTANMTYLRPETAQGMFADFKSVLASTRQKIPFGIAQIGKSFRNEITPGNFIYRMREFEIAEIEFFTHKGEDDEWFNFWLDEWEKFFLDMGVKKENLVRFEHPKASLAHYSKKTVDLNYKFPFGEVELAGVANRTDYDLKSHGQDYFDEVAGQKYIPYVIEPTLGIERAILAILLDAFEEVEGGRTKTTDSVQESEIVLHLKPELAPVKVAVLPLVNKLDDKARGVYKEIKTCFTSEYDKGGSIGRRYRRQDEIGTPYCVTIDFDTLKDNKVTVRDRDTMEQERVKIDDLKSYLWEKLGVSN